MSTDLMKKRKTEETNKTKEDEVTLFRIHGKWLCIVHHAHIYTHTYRTQSDENKSDTKIIERKKKLKVNKEGDEDEHWKQRKRWIKEE